MFPNFRGKAAKLGGNLGRGYQHHPAPLPDRRWPPHRLDELLFGFPLVVHEERLEPQTSGCPDGMIRRAIVIRDIYEHGVSIINKYKQWCFLGFFPPRGAKVTGNTGATENAPKLGLIDLPSGQADQVEDSKSGLTFTPFTRLCLPATCLSGKHYGHETY